MSNKTTGVNNPMYGKKHSIKTLELMRTVKLGKKFSDATKLALSKSHNSQIHVYKLVQNDSTNKSQFLFYKTTRVDSAPPPPPPPKNPLKIKKIKKKKKNFLKNEEKIKKKKNIFIFFL